jgi:hypothetical protein
MKKQVSVKRIQEVGILFLVFFLMLSLLSGCKGTKNTTRNSNSNQETKTNTKTVQKSVENFDEFYHKFHTDSVFQKSRIKFPLQGKMINGQEEINWTKDNWMIMKTRIFDIDTVTYKISHEKTETSFYQKFWLEDSGQSAEYRFELIGNKWYLVYALDQNL